MVRVSKKISKGIQITFLALLSVLLSLFLGMFRVSHTQSDASFVVGMPQANADAPVDSDGSDGSDDGSSADGSSDDADADADADDGSSDDDGSGGGDGSY